MFKTAEDTNVLSPSGSLMYIVSDFMEWVDQFGIWMKIIFSIFFSLIVWAIVYYGIYKTLEKIVKNTEVKWDDKLFGPMSKRSMVLFVGAAIHLTIIWIDGGEGKILIESVQYFLAFYILMIASMLTISVRILMPSLMERFSKSNVAVTGSHNLVSAVCRAGLWIVAIFLALNALSIDIDALFASLAVFSLIVGFGIQATIGNIMNSFLLSIDRPFEPGDRVEVDGIIGTVASVGILSTKFVQAHTEKLVIIPNNTLVQSTIFNYARGGGDGTPTRLSVTLDIGVSYDERAPHVKETLIQVGKSCPYTMSQPEPRVLFTEFADSAKIFRLYCWLASYDDEWPARDWLFQEIDIQFEREGIMIPYPHRITINGQPSPFGDGPSSEAKLKRKEARQNISMRRMARLEERQRAEREQVRNEIEWLEKQLEENEELEKDQRISIEEDITNLKNTLDQFEGGGD